MSKGYLWIVGVYTAIAFGIFLFIFWRDAFFGIGTPNLIVIFASIVIGVPVIMTISSKITGKVDDSGFHLRYIIGILWAFLGIFVGLGLGLFFAIVVMPHSEGGGMLVIPGSAGGAIGGAIGG